MDFTESCNALAPAKHSTAFLKNCLSDQVVSSMSFFRKLFRVISQHRISVSFNAQGIKLPHRNYLESLVSTVFQSILAPRELSYITDQITDAGLCKNSKYFSSKHTKFQSSRVLGFKQIFSSKIFLFPELPDAGPFVGTGAWLQGVLWASHTPQCGHPRVHP